MILTTSIRLQSFHNFPGSDTTQEMTMYIEKTHKMTQLFFDNLQVEAAFKSAWMFAIKDYEIANEIKLAKDNVE